MLCHCLVGIPLKTPAWHTYFWWPFFVSEFDFLFWLLRTALKGAVPTDKNDPMDPATLGLRALLVLKETSNSALIGTLGVMAKEIYDGVGIGSEAKGDAEVRCVGHARAQHWRTLLLYRSPRGYLRSAPF